MVASGKYFYAAGIGLIFLFSFFPQLIMWVL